MKNLIIQITLAISAITINSSFIGNATSTTELELITFYEVPLICGAHTEIGCGSRAKPALLEFEKNAAIKEAWLNRKGTVFAIVWYGSKESKKVAKQIFDKFEIDFKVLKGKDVSRNTKTFRQTALWYRGTDVDKLSLEEAVHIAQTITAFALNKKIISPFEADKLQPEIEIYFKSELVLIRSPQELYDDSENKFRTGLETIAINTLGKERAASVIQQYYHFQQEECMQQESCCTKKSKSCKRKK